MKMQIKMEVATFAEKSDCLVITDSILLVAIVYCMWQHKEQLDTWWDVDLPVGRETDILVHRLEKMIAPRESLLFLSKQPKHCIEHNQCFQQPNVPQNRMPVLPWVSTWTEALSCLDIAFAWLNTEWSHQSSRNSRWPTSCRPGFLPASVTALANSLSFTQSSHRTPSPSQSSHVSIHRHALFPTNSVSLETPNPDVLFGFLIAVWRCGFVFFLTCIKLWTCVYFNTFSENLSIAIQIWTT